MVEGYGSTRSAGGGRRASEPGLAGLPRLRPHKPPKTCGVKSGAGSRRKAPAQAELRPTFAGAYPLRLRRAPEIERPS